MWLPSELAAFAQVVELGSFTACARARGVPKVAVSRAIQSLEKRAGTRLLPRPPRRTALTDAGGTILPHAHRLAAETAAARRTMRLMSEDRQSLRVLADPAYGRLLLAPLLPRFMESYPDIPLEVEMAVALPDEPGEHWDILFQNGPPRVDGLVATALGRPLVLLCATPAYLRAHEAVKQPADLVRHAGLRARRRAKGALPTIPGRSCARKARGGPAPRPTPAAASPNACRRSWPPRACRRPPPGPLPHGPANSWLRCAGRRPPAAWRD